MRIVDMRLRPPMASWTDKPQYKEDSNAYVPTRIGFPRPPSALTRSFDTLLEEMDQAGIQWGVIMGRKSKPPLGVIPNEDISAFIARYPGRFVSFVGVSVSDPAESSLAEIRKFIRTPGFVGVSIEPCCADTPMHSDDRRIYPIYEACQSLDRADMAHLAGHVDDRAAAGLALGRLEHLLRRCLSD